MFNCAISVFLPVVAPDMEEPWQPVIAQYKFDPGLQVGNEIEIVGAPLYNTKVDGKAVESTSPKFSFRGRVIKRQQVILPDTYIRETGERADVLELQITLEIADKEQIGQMTNVLKERFGMSDYTPPALQEE